MKKQEKDQNKIEFKLYEELENPFNLSTSKNDSVLVMLEIHKNISTKYGAKSNLLFKFLNNVKIPINIKEIKTIFIFALLYVPVIKKRNGRKYNMFFILLSSI